MCHLVVGDFAHLGHDQLLLLFKGEFDRVELIQVLMKSSSNPGSELDFHVTDLAQFSTAMKVVNCTYMYLCMLKIVIIIHPCRKRWNRRGSSVRNHSSVS